jgi:DHA2 family multidrug resistance protein
MDAPHAPGRISVPTTYSPALDPAIKWFMVVVMTLVTSMEFLTNYAVTIALPDMQGDLAASFDEGSWILTAYSTCFLVALLLSNWLSDRIGYRRHMTLAVALFTISSAACGLSHTLGTMLVWRCVMGFAGGTFLVRAQTAIYRTHLGKDRMWPLVVLVLGVVVLARTLGPVAGGYLTEWYSWRYVFFLNVPFSLAAVVLLHGFLPDVQAPVGHMPLDLPGLLLLLGWIAPLQIVLSRGERDDWFADPFILLLAVTAALCLPLFIWWECRAANRSPITDFRVYRSRNFALGSIYVVVLGMMLYSQVYLLPQFLRNVQHHSAWGTGELQSLNAAAFAAGLVAGGFLMMTPIGFRGPLAFGAVVFAAGMWCWTTRLTPAISDRAMILPLVLTGFGAGWQIGPMSTMMNSRLPNVLMGVGMKLYLCLRQLGGSWGIAILTILVDRRRSFWSGRLGEHVNPYHLGAQEAMRQGAAAFRGAGFPQAQAQAAALDLLHRRLLLQSVVNALVDTYWYQVLIACAALLLLLIFAKGRAIASTLRWFVATVN